MMMTYARLLESSGYHNMAFHNHTYTYYRRHLSHPNLGYEYIGVGNGLELSKVWPPSDLEMMEQTVPMFVDQVPFHTYYMTVSGHQFYTWSGNMMAAKNRDVVQTLPYSENVKAYMATQVELDRALANLIEQLKAAGQYENTVIVISADHYPYGLTHEEIEELAGKSIDPIMELHRSSLIIYQPTMEPVYVSDYVSSLDILPTVANLFGMNYDSRLLMGRDVFSKTPELVIFKDRSFIIEEGRYLVKSKQFEPHPGFEVPDQTQLNRIIQHVNAKFYYSTQILDYDYYAVISKAITEPLPTIDIDQE
jgi:lipoteichoic acid synthase